MKKQFICRPYEESCADILAAMRNLRFFGLYTFFTMSHYALCSVTKSHWWHHFFTGLLAICAIWQIASCVLRLRRVGKELN